MKKIIAIIAAVLVCASAAAQVSDLEARCARPLNEVSFSYGAFSIPYIGYIYGGLFGAIFSFGQAVPSKIASTGAFSFEYMRFVHPHVSVGAGLSVECCMLDFQYKDGTDEDGNPVYRDGSKSSSTFVSLMPAIKFQWFTNPHFGMYTKIMAGCFYNNVVAKASENSHAFNLAMQVTPVGMEFGGYNYKGFLEAGVGMQGMLLAGFRYSF